MCLANRKSALGRLGAGSSTYVSLPPKNCQLRPVYVFSNRPSGIIWRNIGMLSGVRATSYLVGYIALIVLLIVYTPVCNLQLQFRAARANVKCSHWPL